MSAPAGRQRNGGETLFSLLQITNQAFPTGAFTHSYGFETWIADRVVDDPAQAERRCRHWLRHAVATADGVAVALAFRRTLYEDMAGIEELNATVGALKICCETRDASLKTGAALTSACRDIFDLPEAARLQDMMHDSGVRVHHAVAYGALTAGLGLAEDVAVETFLWTSFANLVSVIGRLVPLGQVDVQRMVAAVAPLVAACAEIARTREEGDMCSLYGSLDTAAMRHERLPSRLCMS